MGVLCFTDFCSNKKIGNILTQKSDTEICHRILTQNIVTILSRHVVLCIIVLRYLISKNKPSELMFEGGAQKVL